MPVCTRTSETAHLASEHDADMPERDLSQQPLEPRPILDRGAADPLVVVDYDHAVRGPAQCRGPLPQLILQIGGFAVAENLLLRRLTNVNKRHSFALARANLVRKGRGCFSAHGFPPRRRRER